jgi:hypothetical protein
MSVSFHRESRGSPSVFPHLFAASLVSWVSCDSSLLELCLLSFFSLTSVVFESVLSTTNDGRQRIINSIITLMIMKTMMMTILCWTTLLFSLLALESSIILSFRHHDSQLDHKIFFYGVSSLSFNIKTDYVKDSIIRVPGKRDLMKIQCSFNKKS